MEAATLDLDVTARGGRAKPNSKAWWVEPLEPYAGADMRRSVNCVSTSVLPYLALWPAIYYLLNVSYALTLLVSVPAAGFLLRSYIVFHDCSHGSFMPTKRLNTRLGVFVGLIVFSPFHSWRQEHAGHHATSGDLDRRGVGDVDTWTVAEYYSVSVDDMKSKRRDKHIVFPRQVAMYVVREETPSSLPVIGQAFGGRDHTTALHSIEKIINELKEDERLRYEVQSIREQLYATR